MTSTISSSMIEQILPPELFLKTFAFLGVPRDLVSCSHVNRSFRELINNSSKLWEDIAVREYGSDVATQECARTYYKGNWRNLVLDDNKKGAWKVLHLHNKPCYWMYNNSPHVQQQLFYCCVVESLIWDRQKQRVYLLLDARGESDLRPPMPSKLICNATACSTLPVYPPVRYLPDRWTSLLENETPGHYRGYLTFPESVLFTVLLRSSIRFCYANGYGGRDDYHTIELFYYNNNRSNFTTRTDIGRSNADKAQKYIPWDGYTSRTKLMVDARNESLEEQRARWLQALIPLPFVAEDDVDAATNIIDRPGWWV